MGAMPFVLHAAWSDLRGGRITGADIALPACATLIALPALVYLTAAGDAVGACFFPIRPDRYLIFLGIELIPWLLIAERVSRTGTSLADMLAERVAAYPCSGEINFVVKDAKSAVARVLAFYEKDAPFVERVDGVSVDFGSWRFNLRSSNTEPLLRLNVESRGDAALMKTKTEEIARIVES